MTAEESLETLKKLYKELGTDLPRFEREISAYIRQGFRTGDLFLIGAANYYLAYANYLRGGERDKVLFYAIKATAMLDETEEYGMIAKSRNLLGIAYLGQENYQMALDSYNKAYELVVSKHVTAMNGMNVLNNIADCYYELGDYKESSRIIAGCLAECREKTPDKLEDIVVYSINLAGCYIKSDDLDKAMAVLDEVGGWINELPLSMWVCMYYTMRARILYMQADLAGGSRCADKAIEIVSGDIDSYEIHREFEMLAQILIEAGDLKRADKFAAILTGYAEKNGHTIDKLLACRVSAARCRRTGDNVRALEYYEKLDELHEKRMSEVKAMQLTVRKKLDEANEEIQQLGRKVRATEENAAREPMTNLLNRASFLKLATEFLDIATDANEKIGAIFVDIDFFKECNDTYGHAAGDDVIRKVARACAEEEKPNVRFARYGGDEFLGIMHGLQDEEISDIARRISRRIRQADIPNEKNPNGHRVTLSVGVVNTHITERSNTIIDIVNYADRALYHAKNNGKNAVYRIECETEDENGKTNACVRVEF